MLVKNRVNKISVRIFKGIVYNSKLINNNNNSFVLKITIFWR
jgi:hypothetical protein